MVSERWLTVKEWCCDSRTSWQVLGQTLDKTITDKLDPEQALRMVPKVGKEIGTKFGFGTSWRVATTCRAEFGRTIGCVSSWRVTVTRSLAMLWESDQTIGADESRLGPTRHRAKQGYRCQANSTAGKSVVSDDGRRLVLSKDTKGKLMTIESQLAVVRRPLMAVTTWHSEDNGSVSGVQNRDWQRHAQMMEPTSTVRWCFGGCFAPGFLNVFEIGQYFMT